MTAPHSSTIYVNVDVSLEGSGVPPASFGTPALICEHSLEAARLAGPFTSPDEVLDFGFIAGSPAHKYAQAIAAQQPRVRQFYIGRRDSGDANLTESLTAIKAVAPSAFYAASLAERDDTDALLFAEWLQSEFKIGMVQSNVASLPLGKGPQYEVTVGGTATDGNYDLVFTGYGLSSPVTVRVTRSTSPATNNDLATAIAAEIETQTDEGGDIEGVVDLDTIEVDGDTVRFRITDGLASGTVTASAPSPGELDVEVTDQDIGTLMHDASYTRCALLYYHDDDVFADAAWLSRCLAFDLDVRRGAWSFKRLNGVAGSQLSTAEVNAIRAVNANYFAEAAVTSGDVVQAFTAQGWMPSGTAGAGRRIDVTTSLDFAKARYEAELFSVLLREPHDVPFDDNGINRFGAAALRVTERLLAAGHFVRFEVPEGEDQGGTITPALTLPKLRETTTTQRQNREISFSLLAYLKSSIERVQFNVTVRQ